MKKSLTLAIALPLVMTMASCGGPKTSQDEPQQQTEINNAEVGQDEETEFPWAFPEGIKNPGLAEGQIVLSCHSFYPNALAESDDPAEETYIFYNGNLTSVGDTKSSIRSFGEDIEMPNSLIIPIPQGQTAKKGDIVLTWWQSGSGMQRAIVTDDSDPASPKVCYLDLSFKDDGSGFANEHANEQLKPNTFVVMKDGEWQPGAQIFVEGSNETGTLLCATDEDVLMLCFAGKIKAYYRSDCKVIPLNQGLKVGDEVKSTFVDKFSDGYKITKIDESIGRVWVEGSFGNDVKSIFEVYKEQ